MQFYRIIYLVQKLNENPYQENTVLDVHLQQECGLISEIKFKYNLSKKLDKEKVFDKMPQRDNRH